MKMILIVDFNNSRQIIRFSKQVFAYLLALLPVLRLWS